VVESTPWTELASRVLRVALARKDLSYAELATALGAEGIADSERALVSRVSRGTAEFTLLLQILQISGATPPQLWTTAFLRNGSWEQRAAAVLAAELSVQPWIAPPELARRLSQIGVRTSPRTVARRISSGEFSLAFFLQCLTVLGSLSADRYVDLEDLRLAALARTSADAESSPSTTID
jgi:hypothetical protein